MNQANLGVYQAISSLELLKRGIESPVKSFPIGYMMIAIYLLNIFDGLVTYIGVRESVIKEGNVLMVNIVGDPLRLFWVKGIAVVVILGLLFIIYQKHQARKCLYHGVRLLLGAYIAVFLLHLSWIANVIL